MTNFANWDILFKYFTMKLMDYFNYIEEHLSFLAFRIVTRGTLNLNDINIHSESFFMHLLNCIYDWNLYNANAERNNMPGIDLIYNTEAIIIQVSSTSTKEKIQNSLNKIPIAKFNGYNFKFLSLAREVDKLTKKYFSVPKGIEFNPNKDIIDLKTLLVYIKDLPIGKIEAIYNLVKKELSFDTEEQKRETGIAYVINELAKEEFKEVNFDTSEFDIEKKIIKNNLSVFKDIIAQYSVYYTTIQKVYDEYDKIGKNKSMAVLHTINKEYLSNKEKFNGDSLYNEIAKNIKKKLSLSSNLEQFNENALELYVDIVLVDSFIRCKIFEKP